MNTFKDGQKVESVVNAQGMNKGERFTVCSHQKTITPYGAFVTYIIKNEAKELQIANAEFVVKKVQ